MMNLLEQDLPDAMREVEKHLSPKETGEPVQLVYVLILQCLVWLNRAEADAYARGERKMANMIGLVRPALKHAAELIRSFYENERPSGQ